MKTFKQFILVEEDDPFQLGELLNKDCKQFMSQRNKNHLLLRGLGLSLKTNAGEVQIGNHIVPFYRKEVRKDRQPMSTNKHVHEIIDEWFSINFGVSARSKSMFCVGDRALPIASSYGVVYAVFPMGRFHAFWSPDINDLYDELDGNDIGRHSDDEEIIDFMDSQHYIDGELEKAMNSTSEIMIVCDSYYAIPAGTTAQIAKIIEALHAADI